MKVRVQPPWIHKPHPIFTPQRGESQGNQSANHHKYNNATWQNYSRSFLAEPENIHCACGCGQLSTTTDHIIPYSKGGSFWDRRNHQGMAKRCHDRKSGKERHGYIEDYVETKHGRIPKRNAHLPLALGNLSSRLYDQTNTEVGRVG